MDSSPGGRPAHHPPVLTFRPLFESQGEQALQDHVARHWPRYREWYFRRAALLPGLDYRAQFAEFMPELLPLLDRYAAAGFHDQALLRRFLSLYSPPAFLTGCSQAVWTREGGPVLLRNYDYFPNRFEAVVTFSHFLRPLVFLSDCLWGVLDGMNDAGLAVSLAYGGAAVTVPGFGIPVVLRYVLETCETAADAVSVLERIPSHMAYNVTIVDRAGFAVTVRTGGGEEMKVSNLAVGTNHGGKNSRKAYVEATKSVTRKLFLKNRLRDETENLEGLESHFLSSPLYQTAFHVGFGTLYTARYEPARNRLDLIWPGDRKKTFLVGQTSAEPFTIKLG